MGTEEQDNELTDIALCYQSLGVPLDASPAEIEQMYKALTEEYRKKLSSPDPSARADAKRNLQQVTEMYDKVRSSITYHAMEKDHLKKNGDATAANEARVRRPVLKGFEETTRTILCPRCNGTISKGLETCPICKTHLYTATQEIIRAIFTPTKIIVYCLILAAIASFAAYRVFYTDKPKDGMSDIQSFEQKGLPK